MQRKCHHLHEACLDSLRQTGMESDSVRLTGVSLSLSLLVWEVLEHRDVAK